MAIQRYEHQGAAPATGLASPIAGAGDTSFTLVSGTGYPTGAGGKLFMIAVDPGLTSEEKIICSARSGTTVTVNSGGRGADGTTAQAHATGTANVEHVVAAFEIDDDNDHIYTTTRDDHTQYARTDGTRAVTGTQSFVNTTNSGTLAVTGATTAAAITSSGVVQGTALAGTLTGTTGRYVGTTSGAPGSGTFLTNDFADDPTNGVIWICTAGGSPGTWRPDGSPLNFSVDAVRTTTQSITHDTWNLIQFDSATSDTGSHFTTGASAKYTCPIAGRYLVTVSAGFTENVNANTVGAAIYKNGTIVAASSFQSLTFPDGTTWQATVTERLRCAASDTIQGYANVAVNTVNLLANKGLITVDYLGA